MQGADNMAKVLYTKENKELSQTIEQYTDGLIFAIQMEDSFKKSFQESIWILSPQTRWQGLLSE